MKKTLRDMSEDELITQFIKYNMPILCEMDRRNQQDDLCYETDPDCLDTTDGHRAVRRILNWFFVIS